MTSLYSVLVVYVCERDRDKHKQTQRREKKGGIEVVKKRLGVCGEGVVVET